MARLDSEIKKDVEAELVWEPAVDPAEIGVSVDDGIVTLHGTVSTFGEKSAAMRAAKRVNGVRGVVDKMEVKLLSQHMRTDEDIAKEAVRALQQNVLVPADKIRVTVRDGILTLEGDVDWQYQRNAAENAVKYLPGVKLVTNLIKLAPRISPSEIKRRIEDALKRSAQLEAQEITVEAEGGRITLRGTVSSVAERDAAEDAAWLAPGVAEVINHIKVEPAEAYRRAA